MYNIILHKNFILYLKESEYRFITNKFNDTQKEEYLRKILKIVYELNNDEFYDEEELIDFDNYDM